MDSSHPAAGSESAWFGGRPGPETAIRLNQSLPALHHGRSETVMPQEPRNVGVIGCGTMGSGIAQTFAWAGYDVVLRDLGQEPLDRAIRSISTSLDRLVSRNK